MSLRELVANRYRLAGVVDVGMRLEEIKAYAVRLGGHLKLINDLIRAGEARRLGRVTGIKVGPIQFDGKTVKAQVTGVGDIYSTRITVAPKRGHHCTCPDWEQRGRDVGPCKHVLALGLAWKERDLDPAMDALHTDVHNVRILL